MIYSSLPKNISKRKISTRWWWGLLFSALIVFPCKNSYAQIEPPTIEYVTINTLSGLVEIYWTQSPTPSVKGYYIQEKIGPSSFPKIRVDGNSPPFSHHFEYSKVYQQSVGFNMFAFEDIINQGEISDSTHFTVFSSLKIDSCYNAIQITWTPYIGWGVDLSGYTIFILDPFSTPIKSIQISEPREFKFTDVEPGREYCFYVNANRNSMGLPSTSNKVCITVPKLTPSYIIGNSTLNNQNQVDLFFTVDKEFNSGSYRLYRSDSGKNKYKAIADLNKDAEGSVKYSDKTTDPRVYDYKLVYLNTCNDSIMGSEPINNILLNGRSQALTNSLNWNSFSSWANGTDEVNIYRTTSQGNQELIATLSANETEYADVISPESQMTGDICYQVKFVSNTDQLGKINISESNIFCVNMLGEVFVPNAFTPNDDGLNDIFKPSFSILPTKYSFIVYNRYGAKIYETNNFSEGWNGKLPDGDKALEGAYIYYIRIENGAGKVVEKRGNFTVIYP